MRITPYCTAKGGREGVVLTFEDITEIKRHREALEELVDERTAEIQSITALKLEAEATLRHYKEKHDKINRFNTVGEIATGIAHEINQPLANITNYIHGVQERLNADDYEKEELKLVLDKLYCEAERTSSIVNNMRNLIQKKSDDQKKVNVNGVIHNVVLHLKSDLNKHKVKCKLILDDCLPCFKIASLQLEQILINVISNSIDALRAVPASRRKIRLRSEYDDAYLRISIEDDGDEIPISVVKKMFDLFFTTKNDGLGMGLAITRSIVEFYGGCINYASDNERHNIIKITLPREGSEGEF